MAREVERGTAGRELETRQEVRMRMSSTQTRACICETPELMNVPLGIIVPALALSEEG